MKNLLDCTSRLNCAHERDKGWAWVIAGAAFMASGATFGVWKTLSIFFNDWTEDFEEDAGRVSYVQSISFAMLTCASPIAGACVRKFGSRPTVMLGGLLAATGTALSYFAVTLDHLYIFIGGIAHFGICLTYLPSFISLGMWMDKRRTLANSIAEMGGPLLAFVLPLIFQRLRVYIGWRCTMLVASGIYLMIVVSGLLQKPFAPAETTKESNDEKRDLENNVEKRDFIADKSEEEEALGESAEEAVVVVVPIYRRPAVCGKILFYMIYCLFQFGGLFALNLFIVPYATEDRGFTGNQSSYLLSINAALDFIGRPLSGALLSLPLFSKRRIELIALFMALYGFVCFLFRFAYSYSVFATLYGAAGLLFGFWNGTYWTVIPDIFGEELFPLAASCGMMMGGVALLLTSPIAGSLIGTSVGYNAVAYQSSIQLFIAAILLFFLKRNFPCCKIELPVEELEAETPALQIEGGNRRVGEKLASIPLNTEQEMKDVLFAHSLAVPSGSTFKQKTFSVVDLAMSMTPGTSMNSLHRHNRSTYSLGKELSNELRASPVPKFLSQTTKSATSLKVMHLDLDL